MRRTRAQDPAADPFGERAPLPWKMSLPLLGGLFQFESDNRRLLSLVEAAYAGLSRWRAPAQGAPFRVRLRSARRSVARTSSAAPPPLRTVSGPGELLCGIMDADNFAVVSPHGRAALISASPEMMRHAYHLRYELIEFAVFTLASRGRGLVPLHAACVGRAGRGLLLVGSSGAGKSTLALHCLMLGMNVLSEDAVFLGPEELLATGVPNYLHLRPDALRFITEAATAARIRASPTIQRRSGVAKFEVDLRRLGGPPAVAALEIVGVVFLSTRSAGPGATLTRIGAREMTARITAAEPYPAHLPTWDAFRRRVRGLRAFELRRGAHPSEGAVALRLLLD